MRHALQVLSQRGVLPRSFLPVAHAQAFSNKSCCIGHLMGPSLSESFKNATCKVRPHVTLLYLGGAELCLFRCQPVQRHTCQAICPRSAQLLGKTRRVLSWRSFAFSLRFHSSTNDAVGQAGLSASEFLAAKQCLEGLKGLRHGFKGKQI